jgi:hypothetical protein
MHMTASVVRAVLLAVTLACTASAAAAQARPTLEPGMRVRVSAPSIHAGRPVLRTGPWIVGTVRETTPTSVVIQTDPADSMSRTEIPYDVIGAMELSEGVTDTRSSVKRGAVRGLTMGAAVATVYAASTALFQSGSVDVERKSLFSNDGVIVARNAGIVVGLSTLAGAAMGTRAREKWTPVGKPRIGVGTALDGRTTLSIDIAI